MVSSRRRWWTLAATVGLGAAVVAGLVAYAVTPRAATVIASPAAVTRAGNGPGAGLPELAAGRQAPGFSLARLGGGPPVTLAAERGQPVVVNFFASWCTDCRAELHAFAKVSQAEAGKVAFVGVDVNDHAPTKARQLLAAAGDHYPVGIDASATVANGKYLVEALPATVFISASGRIAAEAFGAQSVTALDKHIRSITTPSAKRAS